MITLIQDLPQDVVGILVQGSVEAKDYQTVLKPIFQSAKEQDQKLKLLVELDSKLQDFSMSALWEDFKLGISSLTTIDRCALVCDQEWLDKTVDFLEDVLPMEVETFESDEFEEALEWLQTPEKAKIHYRFDRQKGQLEVFVDDELRSADFAKISGVIDPWISQNGNLKGLILQSKDFPGWEDFRAAWDHLGFVKKHHDKVDRIAVVGGGFAASTMPVLVNMFTDAEIKHFPTENKKAAVEFIHQ